MTARRRPPAGLPSALLALWLAAAAPAGAADYLLVHAETDGALLIDRDSLRRTGERAEAWTLYRYDRPVPPAPGEPRHAAMRSRYVLDCRARRLAITERIYLASPAGTAVGRATVGDAPLREANSPSERMLLAAVCGR